MSQNKLLDAFVDAFSMMSDASSRVVYRTAIFGPGSELSMTIVSAAECVFGDDQLNDWRMR